MASPAVSRPRATYEDLLAVPEHMVAEILDGELFTHARPAPRHARASSRLGMKLGPSFDLGDGGPGGWWIFDEPELHLDEDVAVPDLAGWRRERMAELPDEAFFTLAPDWVCEVLSPKTERIDRGRKLRIYAAAAVSHAWLLNPLVRTLEVYRLESARWSLVGTFEGDGSVRAEPFDAIALELAQLWP